MNIVKKIWKVNLYQNYLEGKEGAISMEMLQAINEKVKELGWNE